MSESISFVLTSCGRTDLLDRTLESFFNFIDHQVDVKVSLLICIMADPNDDLIKNIYTSQHDVFMSFCEGIKRTWEDGNLAHIVWLSLHHFFP